MTGVNERGDITFIISRACPICDEIPAEGEIHAEVVRSDEKGVEYRCVSNKKLFRPTPGASGTVKL